MHSNGEFKSILSSLQPISLEDMDNVKLMNRVDSKFIFNQHRLAGILEKVHKDYYILEIDGNRIYRYESLYYDTPEFSLYKNHHNGKPNRVKIRYRKYVDSGLVYFEVKKKIKEGRTDKHRIQQPEINSELGGTEINFMEKLLMNGSNLEKKIWINFNRITLVNKLIPERITIDFGIEMDDLKSKKEIRDIIIAEVKQDKFSRLSRFVEVLRNQRISSSGISKYALSVAMMNNEVKKNTFKELINKVIKTQNN